MSRRIDGYRRAAGLDPTRKKDPRRETLWELIKRAFNDRSTGIVKVSTVPYVTERWVDNERQISSFMVTLPRWVSEKKVLEAINIGFGFLEKEAD